MKSALKQVGKSNFDLIFNQNYPVNWKNITIITLKLLRISAHLSLDFKIYFLNLTPFEVKPMNLNHDSTLWLYAITFIIILLGLDLYLEKSKLKLNCFKTATIITVGWILAALSFNLFLWFYVKTKFNVELATQKSLEFFTGYLLEKSLSIDNLFVFILIFKYFKIPVAAQRSVLNYGIIGAMVLRCIMIFLGVWLVTKLHWILYLFGALLIISGVKIFLSSFSTHSSLNLQQNFIMQLCRRYLATTKTIVGEKLWLKRHNKIYFTPLFLALIAVEFTDLVFALDSIPAILAILNDPFIIFTSNIFAILGLRAAYFFLHLSAQKWFIQPGIAIILVFIGIKMTFKLKLPLATTLGFIASTIVINIILNMIYLKYKSKITK